MTFASKHGYNGMCLHARLLPSFEESANRLRSEIVEAKLTPPIMIAHSAATFVAQKYLESYALSGLVLVNPFPASKVRHHLSKWGEQEQLRLYDCLRNHSSNQFNKFTSTKDQEEEKLKLKLQFEAILANTTADDDYVNLERGMCITFCMHIS